MGSGLVLEGGKAHNGVMADTGGQTAAARSTPRPPGEHLGDASFDSVELAIVLSHYELGVISAIGRFRRGSAGTPKLLIDAQSGKFVLKRRAGAQSDPARVRFAHRLQQRLADAGFPLPHLVGTRSDRRTSLRINDRVYELFRFLEGGKYDGSKSQTRVAGYALALFHEQAAALDGAELPEPPSYHNNPRTPFLLRELRIDGERHHDLALRYEHAASAVEQLGVSSWPRQTIHGDWHPGNMLFEEDRLAAVIDYDTARRGPRALDLAAAALQFSLTAGGPPEKWPAALDEERFVAFLRGYEALAVERSKQRGTPAESGLVSRAELRAMPGLMVESLISEAVAPIAATGRFGMHDAGTMLEAVHRKVAWMNEHGERLAGVLDG